MSSNRLMYDTCEYKTKLDESAGTLEYLLDNMKYENCNKCRMELGIIGGSGVSHIKGNLVDLEADLFGITRKASLCPSKKYNSSCATKNITECNPKNIVVNKTPTQVGSNIDTTKMHLPSCNMIRYHPIPNEPPIKFSKCGN